MELLPDRSRPLGFATRDSRCIAGRPDHAALDGADVGEGRVAGVDRTPARRERVRRHRHTRSGQAQIRRMQEQTGGFGTFLNLDFDFGNWDATRRSYELFAEEVIPYFRDSNRNRVASIEYSRQHSTELLGGLRAAIEDVTHQHFGDDRTIYIR